jgi:hypothetical protein
MPLRLLSITKKNRLQKAKQEQARLKQVSLPYSMRNFDTAATTKRKFQRF